MYFGGNFHKLLEYRNSPKKLQKARAEIRDEFQNLTPRQLDSIGDTYLQDLDEIFSDYLEVWEDSDIPVETEHEFLIQIGKYKGLPVYFHGKIDEVYDDKSFGEHKTFNRMPDMGVLAMNMQACLYSKAWELERGYKLTRVRWDYIKSTPAKRPIWLPKSNRFSEATNSNITDLSWRRACDEQGIDDPDVIAKGEQYRQNRSNFFFRCSIDIVPKMVDTVWDDFRRVAKDIVVRGEENKVKNITRDCSWCDYRPICFAEFTGADPEYVKKRDFVAKKGDNNNGKQ